MSTILPVKSQHLFNNQIHLNRAVEVRIFQCALIVMAAGSLAFLYTHPDVTSCIKDFYNRKIHPILAYCGNKVKPICVIFCKIILTLSVGVGRSWLSAKYIVGMLKNSSTYLPIPRSVIWIANQFGNVLNAMHLVTYIGFLMPLGIKRGPILATVLLAPMCEELLFRFCFQELLLKQAPKFAVRKLGSSLDPDRFYLKCSRIALTAILFAAAHRRAFSRCPSTNPHGAAALPALIFSGLVLGAAQEITGNVIYPFSLHAINNILVVLGELARQKQA